MSGWRALAWLCLAALAGAPAPAAAHTQSRSHSSWAFDAGGALVSLHVAELDLTAIPPAALVPNVPAPQADYLAERLRLLVDGERCLPVASPLASPGLEGWLVYRWHLRCPRPGPRVIESELFVEGAPSHLHIARVQTPGGAVVEAVLAGAERRFAVPTGVAGGRAAGGSSLAAYVALGVEHILTGWDHLAFVLALVLLARRFAELATLVTSFTVAHSVTLALAVLGILRPDPAAVEALIGFSIALVAVENAWLLAGCPRWLPVVTTAGLALLAAASALGSGAVSPLTWLGLALFAGSHFGLLARSARPGLLRGAVAFGFGLVHGFGFAGVLAEVELPRERLAAALFGFNAGVEIGQLVVVALCWPLLWLLARRSEGGALRLVAELGSAGIAGLGVFWFVTRSFG